MYKCPKKLLLSIRSVFSDCCQDGGSPECANLTFDGYVFVDDE